MTSGASVLSFRDDLSPPITPDDDVPANTPDARLDTRRVLVFAIAGRTRCADLGDVREIVPITPTTRLPGAPRHVRGLINLRGTLVTIMDAALCLYGVPADGADASILLVEHRGRLAGVVVDNVFDIQALPAVDVNGGALLDLRAMVDDALA
ncbi:MAG TPA: chemotaxis protein CheW [Gemmatimonadaceae bacterium]|nr:chemotaxis protein CheW [Gemmatimonadaceae bacterium]